MPPRTDQSLRSARRVGPALLIAVLLVLTACTSPKHRAATPAPITSTAPAPTVTPTVVIDKIQFADCTDQIAAGLPRSDADRVNRLEFGCGRVDVPLDYSDPSGIHIPLYVVRVHDSSQSSYQGSLIAGPTQAGASGVNQAVDLGLSVPLTVLDHFDIVGFDPRGVFLSDPLQCITNAQKDQLAAASPDVRTSAGLARAKALRAPLGAECAKKYGARLGDYNTTYTARDLDIVRQAVGDDRLTYLGQAYSARIGTTYSRLFNGASRAMVLDGPSDPSADPIRAGEVTLAGLEKSVDAFAADCATQADCRGIGAARSAITTLARRAEQKPIPTTRTGDHRRAGRAVVLGAVAQAVPDPAQWPALATALAAAQHGDAADLFTLADAQADRGDDGTYSNQLEAGLATTCNDTRTRPTDSQIQAAARTWVVKYPILGLDRAAALLDCRNWPAAKHPLPAAGPATTPILLLADETDGAAGPAVNLARSFGRSASVLTWRGLAPAVYPGIPCTNDAVDRFLIDATPPDSAVCPTR